MPETTFERNLGYCLVGKGKLQHAAGAFQTTVAQKPLRGGIEIPTESCLEVPRAHAKRDCDIGNSDRLGRLRLDDLAGALNQGGAEIETI